MGGFLTKPVTDTHPFDDTNGKYAYGSSSMQGYRTSQEDAHMCLLDFDTETSLFGVFDGHGGAEVALYTAQKFPDFLKNNESYKKQDYETALKEAFIEFDASLIRDDVIKELKQLAGYTLTTDEEDEDTPDLAALNEEAKMPLHELVERLATKKDRKSKLKAQKSIEESISSNEQCSSSSKSDKKSMEPCSSSKLIENGESSTKDEVSSSLNEGNEAGFSSSIVNKSEETQKVNDIVDQPSSSNKSESDQETIKNELSDQQQEPSSTNQSSESSSASSASKPEKKRIKPTHISTKVSFLQMLDEIDEDDSDDDSMLGDEDSEDDSEMYDDSEDESDEDESESDEDSDDEELKDADSAKVDENNSAKKDNLFRNFIFDEGPGQDSGCTAVICLLKDNKLYVANAGDSRAVLSRAGKAIEMSDDHKPTNEIEYNRIKKAGGKVTQDARVNGGLNLSRAFGDHSYKKNKDLPLEEQMITALPDIKVIDILPEDDFIVIACDGIWNSMNSEEVIDYINEEMKKEKKLSKICDSLFFKCLAEDTRGDGSGCDNQTCIIVKLKDLPDKETENNSEVKESEHEIEIKIENKDQSENHVEESKIVNELNSNENGKRKRDDEKVINSVNGTNSLIESPSSKKTKSELES